ncbi:MAG TPA: NAD-dependent epimerase/dehydratase family protein [Egicoccus sp.]|nr:NAD-dependent epimerase/dehydratase family protein [Egicoccus sp.]HSK24484.1 NAD-dependent epimerase/dehydratase family protein [Egicoccus sp.]
MRTFLVGGSGVIGRRLIPRLVAAGHEVTATTRHRSSCELLRDLGADPVVLDVFDLDRVCKAMAACGPELVLHEVTDLPDDPAALARHASRNARVRQVGTRNLVAAARASGASRLVAQSVAWHLGGAAGAAVADLEAQVLGFGGVVVRYGRLYGPDTYHPDALPDAPRIHVDEAARRTVEVLGMPSGVVTLVDESDEP